MVRFIRFRNFKKGHFIATLSAVGFLFLVFVSHRFVSHRFVAHNNKFSPPRNEYGEISFEKYYTWPLDIPDLQEIVSNIVDGHPPTDILPEINPFNDIPFIISNFEKCRVKDEAPTSALKDEAPRVPRAPTAPTSAPKLVILIKSSITNTRHRSVIRKTWGNPDLYVSDNGQNGTLVKILFLLGSCNYSSSFPCQKHINDEHSIHRDIIQGDFLDNYYNSTLKTLIAYKWLAQYCSKAEFAFLTDDDFYVSVANILKMLHNPLEMLHNPLGDFIHKDTTISLDDDRFLIGYLINSSRPTRHPGYKWYKTIDEYPYDRYPKILAGGGYLVSNRAFKEIYTAASYVKFFPFDDIYLGMLARNIGIKLIHTTRVINDNKPYERYSFQDIIAFHTVGNYSFVQRIWNEQMLDQSTKSTI